MRHILLAITAFVFSISSAHAVNAYKITNAVAKTECSDCHMAYAPIFLPKASWEKILGDLSNHFGEDASLDSAKVKTLIEYYVKNSSDVVFATETAAFEARKAAKIKAKKSIKRMHKPKILTFASRWKTSTTPARIQDVAFFKARHHFSENCAPVAQGLMNKAKIKTMAMCSECHSQLPVSGSTSFRMRVTEEMTDAQQKAFFTPAEFKCFFE